MNAQEPSGPEETPGSPPAPETADATPESADIPGWLREMAAGRFRGVVWYTRAWRGRRGVPGVLERDVNTLKLWDATGAEVFAVPVASVKLRHGYNYTTLKLRVEGQWWRLWGDIGNQRHQPVLQELAERHQAFVEAPRFPGTTDKEYQQTRKNPLKRQQLWYAAWQTALSGDKT